MRNNGFAQKPRPAQELGRLHKKHLKARRNASGSAWLRPAKRLCPPIRRCTDIQEDARKFQN
jgi:hypothetical protein